MTQEEKALQEEKRRAERMLEREAVKARVLQVLTEHVGRANAIDMGELYRRVYGEEWRHKINDTRRLRTIITELRRGGAAIGSSASQAGGGYYLMSGSELQEWADRVQAQALRKLGMVAKLRRRTLPELLGQIAVEAKDYEMEARRRGAA